MIGRCLSVKSYPVAFGENLVAAFRSVWEHEVNQRILQDVKEGLQSMAADDAAAAEGQKFRLEVAKSTYWVGTQTVDEVIPHVSLCCSRWGTV